MSSGTRSMTLCASAVSCRRGGRTILREVDLDVPAGTRLAIVGPNGAGKSTLLRTLCGLERPATGRIRLAGDDLDRLPARRRALSIAVVGQDEHPSAELTVAEAVGLGRTPYRSAWSTGNSDDHEIIRSALEQVGLGGWERRSCMHLSGGERHRVVLARAIAQQTPIVVLDEPTNHLDAAWRLRLMQILDDLDATVIAAMHDLDLVLRHFDSVAVVFDGGITAHGPPVEVLTPDLLTSVFDVSGTVVSHPETGLPHLLLNSPITAQQAHTSKENR
ncbi:MULTISPECIES: ABC transporter ATP-binding protein [Gordonia]|uniref:ABC transporter ATP-binding protein n=1 Tax=Gordonia amicalis TaxID=89053 RepID=A0AAE4R4N7_9ACTN|nr:MULTISPECIES: ABC transporter ATP-binding protein [Gordonia]ATD69759.1 molybdate ABC transporter substrate-binding protein [Gordonia sp. 1D]KAF0968559.1 Fe(3+) dicitrate transport ATP-binding protein FecE [Gordonia sp. YY1]MCZ4653202.1 ABC transporter ATP-binding protein [Gordonia amicalis]MDJ0454253.1 ABC transporter ATP-binding protein [Gordonia amicalis]MDV6307526.1 ABC transporter ATP-binding protein [Gordonia amicalis]